MTVLRTIEDEVFGAQLERSLATLRRQLLEDVLSSAEGHARRGGIRALWRHHVHELARLRNQRAVALTEIGDPRGC
ncbi:hypothetical protein [Methylibium petroleiphilum]|uniref:hypothetical protein n=1 Tax=Methylibium petroleiphilum TaxID=105560 RepID=UPI001AC17208|nr:hypothetical protein [Methylibium petroleiphilum]MBN9203038.1 hypothetical protein [Methylibium petroleiphilum]